MRIADIKKIYLCSWMHSLTMGIYNYMNTTLAVQEAQQLVVTLLTFQQTPQATVKCVGRLRDTRRELWMPFIHLHIHMEKLIGIHQILHRDH